MPSGTAGSATVVVLVVALGAVLATEGEGGPADTVSLTTVPGLCRDPAAGAWASTTFAGAVVLAWPSVATASPAPCSSLSAWVADRPTTSGTATGPTVAAADGADGWRPESRRRTSTPTAPARTSAAMTTTPMTGRRLGRGA